MRPVKLPPSKVTSPSAAPHGFFTHGLNAEDTFRCGVLCLQWPIVPYTTSYLKQHSLRFFFCYKEDMNVDSLQSWHLSYGMNVPYCKCPKSWVTRRLQTTTKDVPPSKNYLNCDLHGEVKWKWLFINLSAAFNPPPKTSKHSTGAVGGTQWVLRAILGIGALPKGTSVRAAQSGNAFLLYHLLTEFYTGGTLSLGPGEPVSQYCAERA